MVFKQKGERERAESSCISILALVTYLHDGTVGMFFSVSGNIGGNEITEQTKIIGGWYFVASMILKILASHINIFEVQDIKTQTDSLPWLRIANHSQLKSQKGKGKQKTTERFCSPRQSLICLGVQQP